MQMNRIYNGNKRNNWCFIQILNMTTRQLNKTQ